MNNRIHCSARTRKGAPCPINADRIRNGAPYCHVHDPQGVYQQQNRGELPRHRAEAQPRALDRQMDEAVGSDRQATTLPPIQLDPNWNPPDGCPFEPGVFHQYAR